MRVPLLNFEGGPGILLLNFEGGPGVPLLNFEGGPGSWAPGPTFTPCLELVTRSEFFYLFRKVFFLGVSSK